MATKARNSLPYAARMRREGFRFEYNDLTLCVYATKPPLYRRIVVKIFAEDCSEGECDDLGEAIVKLLTGKSQSCT